MKFILLLFFFCVICFVFYGVFASIRAIVRSIGQLAEKIAFWKKNRACHFSGSIGPDIQNCCLELEKIFMMHQRGALSRDEFEQLKQHVLSTFKSHQHTHQEIS